MGAPEALLAYETALAELASISRSRNEILKLSALVFQEDKAMGASPIHAAYAAVDGIRAEMRTACRRITACSGNWFLALLIIFGRFSAEKPLAD